MYTAGQESQEQPHGKGCECSCCWQDEHESALCPGNSKEQPRGAPGPSLPPGEGRGYPVLLCNVLPHLEHWMQFRCHSIRKA